MLTITKAPLRVSFVGGGTDYPHYYREFPGAVHGTSINKFIYIITLPMVGYAETKYRITYRTVEAVDHISEIKHKVIRATLEQSGYDEPLNIAIISDLPGNSGLGSSSSFTVGFTKLVQHLRGRRMTKFELFKEAVRIELDILGENVGIQDHAHATFGGLNYYSFYKDDFSISPTRMRTDCRDALNESLCLVFSQVQRSASEILEEQIKNTTQRKIDRELTRLAELCKEGVSILEGTNPAVILRDFGALLSEGWETKRKLSNAISTPQIDAIYDAGMKMGAYGGKLCGAGGGGFLLFLAPPECQARMKEVFGPKNFVKIEMEDDGTTISQR